MTRRRLAYFGAAIVVGVIFWTVIASLAFAYLGSVPLYSWFYYAIPWPTDFYWDGAWLLLSGAIAFVPFIMAGHAYHLKRQKSKADVYGNTEWADRKEMQGNGIKSGHRLFK